MKEPKRYCRECGGHIFRHNLACNPPKYRWGCSKGCTDSGVKLKGAPFPTEFICGGPRE